VRWRHFQTGKPAERLQGNCLGGSRRARANDHRGGYRRSGKASGDGQSAAVHLFYPSLVIIIIVLIGRKSSYFTVSKSSTSLKRAS
jgi:hypothetical protein